MPGIDGIAPLRICFITFWACENLSTKELISLIALPLPREILALLEPFNTLGLFLSSGVIDSIIARVRTNSPSSKFSICFFIAPAPGSKPINLLMLPIFFIASSCERKSSNVKSSPLINLPSNFAAVSPDIAFFACSARDATSPMPNIRDAIRSG